MLKRKRIITGLLALVVTIPLAGYVVMPIRFYPGDPSDAKINFGDMRSFAAAHEIARSNLNSVNEYATHYFDIDSDPVESLVWQLDISAETTANDVAERPKAYDAIVHRFANIEASEPAIRSAYKNLETAYPDAVYPPVYFAFSAFRARALIRPYGVILGAEYFVASDNDDSIEGWHDGRGLMVPIELLPSQLIHELAHIQQARKSPMAFVSSGKVLNWTIFEGAADFVATVITGNHSNPAAHAYLLENGDALWCVFYDSMDANRRTYWLDPDVFGAPPGGFASAFGYNIAAAFYAQHEDKQQALVKLIELADYEDIFIRSGYSVRLKELCDGPN